MSDEVATSCPQAFFIHHHFFKNAGSTIDGILRRNFPSAWQAWEPTNGQPRIGPEEIRAFMQANPAVRAVSSHNFRPPLLRIPGKWIIDICVLRHPLDRLRSIYQHHRRETGQHARALAARAHSLPDFINWLAAHHPTEIHSPQVSLLGEQGDCYFPPSEDSLARAWESAKSFRLLATVEHFDESMVTAECFLRILEPNLDLSYRISNADPAREGAIDGRLAAMKSECGDKIWNWIEDSNRLDLELWTKVTNEIGRRAKNIPDFQQRLAHFHSRCETLQASP